LRVWKSRTPDRFPPIDSSATHTTSLVPVTATVDLGAIRHNARLLQRQAGDAALMAVVKADAYGHGAVPVVRALAEEGVEHFAVARPAEGQALREAGVAGTILVLGAPLPSQLPTYADQELDVTVSSSDAARAVIAAASPDAPLRVHVKIDTGMGRIGLAPEDVPPVVKALRESAAVEVAGIWTHFATADEPENPFTEVQLDRFEAVISALDAPTGDLHAANTGALFTLDGRLDDLSAGLVRSGIALYGLAATPELAGRADLRPAMTLSARVTHVKTLPEGASVSYGATWTAPAPTRIATLGVGYGDGYPRLGSGRASVRIGGKQRPVVGTICMDMCMVDLGPPDRPLAQRVEVGDEAVLFGPDGPTAYDVAQWAETIPYEICCGISPRVPRRYLDEAAPPPDTPEPASS
jgi:alanine racemase